MEQRVKGGESEERKSGKSGGGSLSSAAAVSGRLGSSTWTVRAQCMPAHLTHETTVGLVGDTAVQHRRTTSTLDKVQSAGYGAQKR